ncbi:helix-turn-helix domain-containing protein [Hyphomicrobium sulfonivorans]
MALRLCRWWRVGLWLVEGAMDGNDSVNRRRSAHVNGRSEVESALPLAIGARVRGLRTRRRYSLERLAQRAHVSRAMLSQIENGQSVPTILLLKRVADALDVQLSALIAPPEPRRTVVLTRKNATVLSSAGGSFTLRSLLPEHNVMSADIFEGSIAVDHAEVLPSRAEATAESVVIVRGRAELTVGDDSAPILLEEGDAAYVVETDSPRSLRNVFNGETHFYLVRARAANL